MMLIKEVFNPKVKTPLEMEVEILKEERKLLMEYAENLHSRLNEIPTKGGTEEDLKNQILKYDEYSLKLIQEVDELKADNRELRAEYDLLRESHQKQFVKIRELEKEVEEKREKADYEKNYKEIQIKIYDSIINKDLQSFIANIDKFGELIGGKSES